MKNGAVLAKLANDKRVAKLNLTSDNEQVSIVLAAGYYVPKARGPRAFRTAKAAHAFIKSAQKLPEAREGYYIDYNLMTGLAIEVAKGTPLACNPASETYWSM